MLSILFLYMIHVEGPKVIHLWRWNTTVRAKIVNKYNTMLNDTIVLPCVKVLPDDFHLFSKVFLALVVVAVVWDAHSASAPLRGILRHTSTPSVRRPSPQKRVKQ